MINVVKDHFIAEIRLRRERLGNLNARAIVLMDGHASHKTEQVRAMLASEGIDISFLFPHSSHIIQALDLGVFCTFKRDYQI
jgi:hypothetical protein